MSDPIMLLIISKKLLTLMTMEEIETFIRDNYSPMITESKLGMTCLFKHKDGLTDDGVVFFEFAKRQWSNKPIMNKHLWPIQNQIHVITENGTVYNRANLSDIDFLVIETYSNLIINFYRYVGITE